MKICEKCRGNIPAGISIDGKRRNLKNRKYCLSCSPFGKHNTIKLNGQLKKSGNSNATGTCVICKKEITNIKEKKGLSHWYCANKRHRYFKTERLQSIVGTSCWLCGYDKCWNALDFHHVYPEEKSFQLSKTQMQFSWDRIINEAKKCILICCRCHREVHAGLINQNLITQKWYDFWYRE